MQNQKTTTVQFELSSSSTTAMDNIGGDETDFDITNIINTVLPGEKHLPGMNYCGPGTNLKLKLKADGVTPRRGFEPVDRVDEAAMKHDIVYQQYDDLRHRNEADKEMLRELKSIENPSRRERMERCIVIPILTIKKWIGSLILRLFYRE
jgi:hypothetical protein